MEQLDDDARSNDDPRTANGSGSGAGVHRRPRPARADAREASIASPEGVDRRDDAPPAVPGDPAPLAIASVDAPRATPLRVMPSLPADTASVERWLRPRDLVSIGEVLVEMTKRSDGAFQPSVAGDAYNTLFYAARMGLRTGLVTAVGDDLFTPMLIERIDGEGIDLANVHRLRGRRNGIYFIEHDAWGERSFHYWRDGSAATDTLVTIDEGAIARALASTHFLLVTGVSLAVLREPERLGDLIEGVRGTTTVVLDANYRARLWNDPLEYRYRIESLLPLVDVFLPSRQDLESGYDDREPIDVLRAAAAAGATTIVMKDGANGCAMLVDDELVALPPAERPHVVDTTGAGDAFNAGMIAALLRGTTLHEACELAQRVAARTLIVPGAIDPSFTPHAIDASWRIG